MSSRRITCPKAEKVWPILTVDSPVTQMPDMATNRASRESICCPGLVLKGSRRQSVPRRAPMRKPNMMITVVVSLRLFIVRYRMTASFP